MCYCGGSFLQAMLLWLREVCIAVGEFTTFVPLSLAHRSQPHVVVCTFRFVVIPSRVESSTGNATASVSELRRIAICNHSRRCLACLVHNLVVGDWNRGYSRECSNVACVVNHCGMNSHGTSY